MAYNDFLLAFHIYIHPHFIVIQLILRRYFIVLSNHRARLLLGQIILSPYALMFF